MSLPRNCQKVQDFLDQFGLDLKVIEFSKSTRTAQDAAEAIGCEVGQIVKSLVFKFDNRAVMFLVSGKNKLDLEKVSNELNLKLKKADADFVKEVTGFSIGGVPPVAHKTKIPVFIDKTLLEYDVVWAAAGTPFSVFKIKSNKLKEITKAKIIG
jgi:Cys-tRNA(Pro) deacylase